MYFSDPFTVANRSFERIVGGPLFCVRCGVLKSRVEKGWQGLEILAPEKCYPQRSGTFDVEVKSGAWGDPGKLGFIIPRTGWKSTVHRAEHLDHLGGHVGGPSGVSPPGTAGSPRAR